MSLIQKLHELNWKRNFAFKRWKLKRSLLIYNFIKLIIPEKAKNYNLDTVKSILILRNDRIGDMVATTGLIRNLAKAGYAVYVSSAINALDIIKYNSYVAGVVVYDDKNFVNWFKSLMRIRKRKFDMAVEVKCNKFIDIKNLIFCSYINTDILVGFNKGNVKSFNLSIPYYQANEHIINQLKCFLDILKIKYDDMHYELPVSKADREKANKFINEFNKEDRKIAILNPYGSFQGRCFSGEQINLICRKLENEYQIIITGEMEKIAVIAQKMDAVIYNSESILELIPLIEAADLVVSVDTAVVHIAACFQKRTIAFYAGARMEEPDAGSKKSMYNFSYLLFKSEIEDYFHDKDYIIKCKPDRALPVNSHVWGPNNSNARQILFNEESLEGVPFNIFANEFQKAIS